MIKPMFGLLLLWFSSYFQSGKQALASGTYCNAGAPGCTHVCTLGSTLSMCTAKRTWSCNGEQYYMQVILNGGNESSFPCSNYHGGAYCSNCYLTKVNANQGGYTQQDLTKKAVFSNETWPGGTCMVLDDAYDTSFYSQIDAWSASVQCNNSSSSSSNSSSSNTSSSSSINTSTSSNSSASSTSSNTTSSSSSNNQSCFSHSTSYAPILEAIGCN